MPAMDTRPFKKIVEGTSIVIGSATSPLFSHGWQKDGAFTPVSWGTSTAAMQTRHDNILLDNFNMVVCENESKPFALYDNEWENVESKLRIHREALDVLKSAHGRGAKFKTHTLAWHAQQPRFMQDPGPPAFKLHSPDPERQAVIARDVGIAARLYGEEGSYKIDVLNEAIDWREDIWPNRFAVRKYWDDIGGEEFLGRLFRIARDATPAHVILCYNDFGITDTNKKSDAVYEMCKRMKESGVPIDEVGFQCHEEAQLMDGAWFDRVKENMQRFKGIGLRVNFSEVDIECSKLGLNPEESVLASAKIWGRLVKTALSNPKICNEFTVWGFDTAVSWKRFLDDWKDRDVMTYPCSPWLEGRETPIVQAIRDALVEICFPSSGWLPFGCDLVFSPLTFNRTGAFAGPQCTLPLATSVDFVTYVIAPSNVTVTLKSGNEGEEPAYKQLTTNANGFVPLMIGGLDISKKNLLYVEGPDKYTDFCVVTQSYANNSLVHWEGFGCGLRPIHSTNGRSGRFAGPMLRVKSGKRCTLGTTVYSPVPVKLTMKWSDDANHFPLENFSTVKEDVFGRLEVSFNSAHAKNVYVYLEGPPEFVDFAVDSFTLCYQES